LSRGILCEIFTNATLITEEIASRFSEKPPLGIEVSIYGASSEVYDKVARVCGSFQKAMAGIAALKKYKVGFSLKTMALKENAADLGNMRKLAEGLGVEFKSDSLVCGRKDGGLAPLDCRLPASDIVESEFLDKENLSVWNEMFSAFWKKELKDLTICSAGINSFSVDPYGSLSPCTMYKSFQYPLRQMSFDACWKSLVEAYGWGPNDFLASKCKDCSMVSLCPNCPAWAELETGQLDKPVDYLCQYALLLEKKFFEKTQMKPELIR
jgi:radical SAM protein with 4Fe4S-binding SPASM domain